MARKSRIDFDGALCCVIVHLLTREVLHESLFRDMKKQYLININFYERRFRSGRLSGSRNGMKPCRML